MNAYEQKRVARIERMRSAADKRDAEARAAHKKIDTMLGVMNGTPILVGHHSEKRHRRDIDRMDASMRKSIEATREAEELRRLADGAEESQAVSSDDPDAVAKLRAKLTELERQQAALKTVNARLRAGESLDAVAPLLDWWQNPIRRLAIWQSMGHKTVPTGNVSAEIRRVKARLAELEAKASAPARASEDVNGVRIEGRAKQGRKKRIRARVALTLSQDIYDALTRFAGPGGSRSAIVEELVRERLAREVAENS